MKNKKMMIVLWILCAGNLLLHLFFYPRLPETIPVHWDAKGHVNGEGPRYMALVLALLPAGILLLMRVLPKIDPRHANYEKFGTIYNGFMAAMTVFMVAVSWMTELTVFGVIRDGSSIIGLVIAVSLGILFIILGNYMPRVRQNYSFGIRTPWALADEHNWTRTHRMGGIVFIGIGIFLILAGVLAPRVSETAVLLMILVPVLGGSLFLYLYSYLVYRGTLK